MRVTVVPAAQLGSTLIRRWEQLQEINLELASPFFRPEFTMAASAVYPGIRVGILEKAGRVVGFFPFQGGWGGAARPVAQAVADYQGVVIDPAVQWDPAELIRGCGLSSWEFNCLIASQLPFQRHHAHVRNANVIDLGEGWEAYRRRHVGRDLEKKMRRCEREAGSLRFEIRNTDPAALQMLIQLKRRQYASKNRHDVLRRKTVRQLLEKIHAINGVGFAGMLSILRAGDAVIAAHFGMRSRTVWHHWFPAYDERFKKYSPGLLMLVKMIEAAEGLGIRFIDMGGGDEPYKLPFANRTIPIADGRVGRSLPAMLRRGLYQAQQHITHTFLEAPVRNSYRWMVYRLCK